MKYWLIAIPRDSMEHCISLGIYGRENKDPLLRVSQGDGIVCYVTKASKIIAFGGVSKPYYFENTRIFKVQDAPTCDFYVPDPPRFPHRIGFSVTKLNQELDFRPLIKQLEFIKKPDSWHAYIRRGFSEITESDWNLLLRKSAELDLNQSVLSSIQLLPE